MWGLLVLFSDARSVIKVACIYTATIIGAGFASGQEIISFFTVYYRGGFYGIITAGILFSAVGAIVLDRIYCERINSYEEFIFPLMGWTGGWIVNIAATLFILSLFCIMLAGMGNIIMAVLGIPFIYGVAISAAATMIAVMTDIKGIAVLSTIVTPVLIFGIVGIGLYIIIFRDMSVFNMNGFVKTYTHNWFFSSLLYVGYNSIMAIVVMCSLFPFLKNRKTGILGGIGGGFLLLVIAFIMNTAIYFYYPDKVSGELPVLSIVGKFSDVLKGLYMLILLLAMFISAVNSGFCFVDRVNRKTKMNRKLFTALFCLFAIPLSSFGFSNLIKTIYPVFGYVGLFVVIVILLYGAKRALRL